MKQRFVSEPIRPIVEAIDTSGAPLGEPGVPMRFVWRGTEYVVEELLGKWKDAGPCTSGGGERYVRKHGFHVRTTTGEEMKIYYERQARSTRERKKRWWLYTVSGTDGDK
ncbi:cytoplasmic protein [Candidatus Sumerlaeota bacterium]|nr:cytoplasmic protein [Candidatus Sumerlaeota bacterium]